MQPPARLAAAFLGCLCICIGPTDACWVRRNAIAGGCSQAPACSNRGMCTEEHETCHQTHQTACRGCRKGAPGCPALFTADAAYRDGDQHGWSCDAFCCKSMCYYEHSQKCGKTGCCNFFSCPYGMEMKPNAGSFAGNAYTDLCCQDAIGLCNDIQCEAGFVKQHDAESHRGFPTNDACCEYLDSWAGHDGDWVQPDDSSAMNEDIESIASAIVLCLCCSGSISGIAVCFYCCCCKKTQPKTLVQPIQVSQARSSTSLPAKAASTASAASQPTQMGRSSTSNSQDARDSVTVNVSCGSCRSTVMVSAATSRCRYTCPSCGSLNEFQAAGLSQDAATTIPVEYPAYWKSQNADSMCFSHDTDQVKQAIQTLLDKTWKNQWTRDRGRDKTIYKFEAITVIRNENPKLWAGYFRTREQLSKKLAGKEVDRWTDVKTRSLTRDDPRAEAFFGKAKLRSEVNEFYLFHGTNPSAAKLICDNDFLLDKAGSNAGSLYGPGIYLAEASTKADEYASDDPDGIFQGHFGMLVCRVVCGSIRYSDEVNPPVQELVDSVLVRGTHQSILGDREKCRGTYREFIVFDNHQVYPEYVVIYKRIPQ